MQMTVSSEIENRIDDTNSTPSRTQRDCARTSMPAVVALMGRLSGRGVDARGGNRKGWRQASPFAERSPSGSVQAGDVVGHGLDLAIVHLRGDAAHRHAVLACAAAE